MSSLSRRDSRAAAPLMMMAGVMATLLVGNLLSSLSPMYIGSLMEHLHPVSYTHLTLPTNREV